ncbi:MAG: Asp23/Gls24 family envelope stress response protein [Rhodothermales bacterium]|nr:Asp23/Gls24 family envelope stress response protein [Rhodothermales bacterium]
MATTKAAAKTKETNGSVAKIINSDEGKTVIRDQVVSKIVGLAVREIEGVVRLVPFGAGQSVTQLAKSVTGSQMRDLGVHVEVGETEAAVDVRIISEYGASIPAIAQAIRSNVVERVREMTGLKVVSIDIDVLDLHFAEDDDEVVEPEVEVSDERELN